MKLFAATALIVATVAGTSAFANTPLTASIAYEVQKIVPGIDLSGLSVSQIAALNGLFANTADRDVDGSVKAIVSNAQ